uniref:DDT domain-containing protein n=1 Tax=Syphacia muris TaxID=451379 RepID=A0A158R484_9BILA
MPICEGICWHKHQSGNEEFTLLETGETFETECALKQRELDYKKKKWTCRHDANGQFRTFSEAYKEEKRVLGKILDKMPNAMVRDIFQRIHHSALTAKELAQQISEHLSRTFYLDDEVVFTNMNSECKGRVTEEEEYIDCNGGSYNIEILGDKCKNVTFRVLATNMRRIKEILLDELVILIPLVAQKISKTGFWSLDDTLKQKFKICDKLHSLFTKCSCEKRNSVDETDPGKHNSSSCSLVLKQQMKLIGNAKDTCKQDLGADFEKTQGKDVKRRSKKPLQLKNDASINCSQKSIYKFLLTSPGTSSPSIAISSPRTVAERRYEKALSRIIKLFPAPEPKEFCHACNFALSVLSEKQIESIPYEEIRYGILLQRDKKNDMALSAKMSREEKREYLRLKKKEREEKFGNLDHKLTILLKKKLDDNSLRGLTSLPKLEAVKFGEHSSYFGTCLFITEFLNVFQSLLIPKFVPSAEELLDTLKNDESSGAYIIQHLSMIIMNTLLQTPEVKECFVFGVPISKVPVTLSTLSELIRIILRWHIYGKNTAQDDEVHMYPHKMFYANSTKKLNTQNKIYENILEKLNILEVTELSVGEQIEVMKCLIECVQDSSVFRLFLEETVFDQLKSISTEKDQLEMELLKQKDELRSLPFFPHRSDEIVTRRQAIEENKVEKDRQRFIKSIEIVEEKLKSLLQNEEKCLKTSKRMQRLTPLGYDRYHRRYWFFENSPNKGIYVEKGWFSQITKEFPENNLDDESEINKGKVLISESSEKTMSRGKLFEDFENLYNDRTTFPSSSDSEQWYKICDEKTLQCLVSALSQKGIRESKLLENIETIFDEFNESCKKLGLSAKDKSVKTSRNSKDGNVSAAETLQSEIHNFESELRRRRFTRIDENDFLEKIEHSKSLCQLRRLVLEICESIPEADFRKIPAFVFSLKNWKDHLMNATSVSQLGVLLHVLEMQIKWDYSLRGKKCRICNRGRQEELVICEKCGDGMHLFCIRPKLTQMPPGGLFICSNCKEDDLSDAMETEDDDDAESYSSSTCDDAKGTQLSHEDQDRFTILQKESIKYLKTLKNDRQAYQWLQKVPAGQSKCRSGSITLKSINDKLLSYASEYKLRSDLRALFKAAVSFYQLDPKKQKHLCRLRNRLGL